MAISLTNSINHQLPATDVTRKSVIKNNDTGSGDIQKATFASMMEKTPSEERSEVVSPEEKQFFAAMFPENSSAIKSYSVYASTGMKKNIQLGTIIDAKG